MPADGEKVSAHKLGKKADIILPLLQALYDIKPVNRRSILLNHLDDEACEMIYETIRNVVFNEDLPKNARTRLKKNLAPLKKDVLTLARGKGSSTLCSVLVEDNCDKIRNGEWKERPYTWNPVS